MLFKSLSRSPNTRIYSYLIIPFNVNMMIPIDYTIKTKSYLLRCPNKEDIPRVFSASQHKGFNDGMLWDAPQDPSELLKPLENNIKAWKEGLGYSFTICLQNSTQLLGRISIRKTDIENRWNVGFWTHPETQGKGLMTECLAAIVKFGFTKLDAITIEANHALWNHASRRVLEKNGFQLEKFIEKGFQKNGKWVSENRLILEYESWKDSYKV